MKWNDNNTITVTPPKRPKKCTGTRFGAVLGANKWSTPFEAWCAITRTYEEPFVDTIYTVAGKTIEPKQYEYMKKRYFWKKMIAPSDIWGEDYFKKTYGDFFKDNKIFGGMWDYLVVDANNVPLEVLEMKTTKRVEDWEDDIPEYYALQAALYAYLLGVDNVTMVCTVLEDKDYEDPEKFVVADNNTFIHSFAVSERYPNFSKIIKDVERWWNDHVVTGISPVFDEKKDADILKELRKNNVTPDTDITQLIIQAEILKEKLDAHNKEVADLEKEYKSISAQIKEILVGKFREGDKEVVIDGNTYSWVVSRSVSNKIDDKKLKEAGLYDMYTKKVESYRFTPKARKE